ncbi:nuclear transport factor 2 family protein [Altererythrobacter aerius]|uniref:Nuclear transport factor 2 family protein n=1 Tax=Tsuneonella aeria TaxID=1837929 RepID=A0A6I4TB36_9SPHN|nr:nuclear transport factor 2 family protein [Tsuneonella aeria]MXO74323.1 nuclear transport factor 2 family protein [Tsuneonella aeria]
MDYHADGRRERPQDSGELSVDDHAQLRRAAELYAVGADRRDKDLWRQVLAQDCVIEGPGFLIEGVEANLGSLDFLAANFRATIHRVHQCVATIAGHEARGETYSTADHLSNDADTILVWSIRYQDHWRREEGAWRFARRKLIVDWEETRPVTPKPGAT